LAIVGYLLFDGLPYYLTPLSDRPHHPDFVALRPAGSRGLAFGIIGTTMMLALLLYSVRKRARVLASSGPVRSWLQAHILLGILGPLFITLHTSFKVQGLVALSYWAMIAVALSGVFGRYLYQQIPRNVLGRALSSTELRERELTLDRVLRDDFGLDDEELGRVAAMAGDPGRRRGPWSALMFSVGNDLGRRRRIEAFLRARRTSESARANLRKPLNEKVALRRRLALYDQLNLAFHYWHVIHKPFAVVMYIVLAVHIAVSVTFGYVGGF
jgi:hypothetical protein